MGSKAPGIQITSPNQPEPLIPDYIVHNDHDGIYFKSYPLLQ